MKISASIFSNKEKDVACLISDLDAHQIDMFHVDCINNTEIFDAVTQIRKTSTTPIDLHIISENPEKFYSGITDNQIEYASFQFENLKHKPTLPESDHTQWGLCVMASTPVSEYRDWLSDFDFILLMATTPGVSGGTFQSETFQVINELRFQFPQLKIHVDGGVNDRIAYILRLLGVSTIVSGSYLLGHESLGTGLLSFHQSQEKADSFIISDFAVSTEHLPVIKNDKTTFYEAVDLIEKGLLGFVLVVNNDGLLEGVITNADVRRGLLKSKPKLPGTAYEIMNTNPFVIRESETLGSMIQLLNNLNLIVLFLPVVDAQHRLKGAVLLNNLIRV